MVLGPAQKGIGFIFILPKHLLKWHPFVGMYFLRADKNDLEEQDVGALSDQGRNVDLLARATTDVHDRGSSFIIDDSQKLGSRTKYAEKIFKEQQSNLRVTVSAVVVRERGCNRVSKLLRFAYWIIDVLYSMMKY